jgi:hypothetical protein
MCNSGVRWLYEEEGRWDKMEESAEDFKRLLELPYPKAVENPVMHGHALEIIGRGPDQIVQPWMFGHKATKATGFWLDRLHLLRPTDDIGPPPQRERERRGLWFIGHHRGRIGGSSDPRLIRGSPTLWRGNGAVASRRDLKARRSGWTTTWNC